MELFETISIALLIIMALYERYIQKDTVESSHLLLIALLIKVI